MDHTPYQAVIAYSSLDDLSEEHNRIALKASKLNPIRERANGRPFYVIQIKLWSDDVSGNRTRQWNKHFNWCWTHSGIPQQLQHQEYFVHFLSTSPHATALEQAEAIQKMLKDAEAGVVAWNMYTQEEAMFSVGVLHVDGDNPMQSELAGHMGIGSTNLGCRMYDVGGTKEFKKGDVGYASLYGVRPKICINESKLI